MLPTSLDSKVLFNQPFDSSSNGFPPRAKHYTYCLATIGIALDLRRLGLSNRCIPKVIAMFQRYINGGLLRIPSYNSVRNWGATQGCYYLDPAKREESSDTPWCIIADLSIEIGAQRLLVVVGVDLNKYDHVHALQLSDIKILGVAKRNLRGWTAADIAAYLGSHILPYYSVCYMVSDAGPNLVRAAKDLGITRISDLTHTVALKLKAAYLELPGFEQFTRRCTYLRRYNSGNDFAPLRPPRLRDKARFMNISHLIEWAYHMLRLLKGLNSDKYPGLTPLSAKHHHKLKWLLSYKETICKMYQEVKLINTLSRGLKHEGISQQTVQWAKSHLESHSARRCMQPTVRQGMIHYLEEQLGVAKTIKQASVICSSDIIESCFGYYKHESPKARWLTQHPLRIAAYGRPLLKVSVLREILEANTQAEVAYAIRQQTFQLNNTTVKENSTTQQKMDNTGRYNI